MMTALFSMSAAAQGRGQTRAALEDELRAEVEFFTDSTHLGRETGKPAAQSCILHTARTFSDSGLWTRVQSFRISGNSVGHNVIGFTPGYFDRYIVVSAYIDGIGKVGDSIYPGADSNASGMAALLSIARSIAPGYRGRTGVIFVAFDGHNADMSGSKAFLEKYRSEYNITLMVNLDILGSTLVPLKEGREDYLMALGGSAYDFGLRRANTDGLQLSYEYYGSRSFTDLFYRSIGDQKWFVEKRIPAVMFTSGITDNTNKITDTPQTLNYPVFAKRVAMITRWVHNLL